MPNFENDAVILHRLTEVERKVEDLEERTLDLRWTAMSY